MRQQNSSPTPSSLAQKYTGGSCTGKRRLLYLVFTRLSMYISFRIFFITQRVTSTGQEGQGVRSYIFPPIYYCTYLWLSYSSRIGFRPQVRKDKGIISCIYPLFCCTYIPYLFLSRRGLHPPDRKNRSRRQKGDIAHVFPSRR